MKWIVTMACLGTLLRPHVASSQTASGLQLAAVLPSRDDSVQVWTRGDSIDARPSRSWPTYMTVGGILGGGIVAGYALTHCDQNCRDDGALAFAPPFLIAGAVAGGLVGLVVGVIVDNSHRGALALRISVPALQLKFRR